MSERLVVMDTHNTGRNATNVDKFLWTEAHLNETNYQLVVLDVHLYFSLEGSKEYILQGVYEEEERPVVQQQGFVLTHLDS